jgi:hypothetical protein
MRKAINENRTVQLALLGVLALLGGFLLLKANSGGSEGTPAAPAQSAPSGTAAPPTGTAAAPTDTSTAATSAPTSTVSGASAAAVPANLIPGPGLPKGLLSAYRDGDAIVLLVRRAGGIDDALVRGSVDRLHGMAGVKVFVTKAKGIARYAWLTQGVNVSALPALVVLRPRKVTKGVPTASVSYGFRDSASVVQAVNDALYRGPSDRPYHP